MHDHRRPLLLEDFDLGVTCTADLGCIGLLEIAQVRQGLDAFFTVVGRLGPFLVNKGTAVLPHQRLEEGRTSEASADCYTGHAVLIERLHRGVELLPGHWAVRRHGNAGLLEHIPVVVQHERVNVQRNHVALAAELAGLPGLRWEVLT